MVVAISSGINCVLPTILAVGLGLYRGGKAEGWNMFNTQLVYMTGELGRTNAKDFCGARGLGPRANRGCAPLLSDAEPINEYN